MVVTLTVKDKVVKRFIVIVREQNVIHDCSTHNPVHRVSKYADARCSRWLTKDSEVHRRQFHPAFRPPHCSDDARQQTALGGRMSR